MDEREEEGPSKQRRSRDRRRLWDRRAPGQRREAGERRHRHRRAAAGEARAERRAKAERRGVERRAADERRTQMSRRLGRRRRQTPAPYTDMELKQVRERFASPGPVACPACGGAFTLGPGRPRAGGRRVTCLGCGRTAAVPVSIPARVMVIVPNALARGGLSRVLAGAGHEVIEAADAGVGLEAYRMVPADVVLLDVLASGRMGATDFLRQLRRKYPDARVVAIAGRPSYTGLDPLAVLRGLGAVRGLRTPLSRDQVLKAVEEARP
jgi:CheY-like chemotaxis protein